MDDVVESGPAWESGVRKGDVIVTVNDWLIVLMDRAQVNIDLCIIIGDPVNLETDFFHGACFYRLCERLLYCQLDN